MHPTLAESGRVRPTTVKYFAEHFNGRALCSRVRRLSQFKSPLAVVHESGTRDLNHERRESFDDIMT